MARTLFLHLGPAKTGTSAIQHILSQHDGSVVLYPRVGLWADGSHHNLVLNFFGDHQRPEVEREDVDRLFACIGEAARASDRDLVISSEILAGRKNLGDFANALQSALGGELRVVLMVVVREHRERAASLYNQRVKDAFVSEQRSPDEFLAGHAGSLCYANLLRRLKGTGFALTVMNYHPAESYVARCLAQFGFMPDRIPDAPERNVSLGRKALVATLAANRAARSREERAAFDAALSRMPGRFAPSQVFFTKTANMKVRNTFVADRQFLRQQFGVRLPRPENRGHANPVAISEREFAEIATLIADLGDYGMRIGESLRAFVRDSLGAPESERVREELPEIERTAT